MKAPLIAAAATIVAAIIGITFQDDPYRLMGRGTPADQQALDHRDSPYAHITWVISEGNNYAELRFFDKVEGGVCLRPSWDELGSYGDGSLAHVAMPEGQDISGAPPGHTWPKDLPKPNPGTLAKSPYVNLFPAGVLLNERLMKAAGGDYRKAAPNILVIGLGSGVGISNLAHHFPEASIATVDIDRAVIRMVKDHYPFIDWLSQQQTSDGRPRLKLADEEVADARQYIRYESLRDDDGRVYDLVIVDAYTDGSTIPPHLMTKEFYEDIRGLMADDGIVLSNIIGSYDGPKHRVVGGAIRSKRAAGLVEVHNFPIVSARENTGDIGDRTQRNNIVLASAAPLDPRRNRDGWAQLESFTPYPELPTGRWISEQVMLLNSQNYPSSSSWALGDTDAADTLRRTVRRAMGLRRSDEGRQTGILPDASVIGQTRAYVLERQPKAYGWGASSGGANLYYSRTDWVAYAQGNWRRAITAAKEPAPGRTYVHEGTVLVGPLEAERSGADPSTWTIPNVPLFTDARPNADIFNR